jgi:hypothetical protein
MNPWQMAQQLRFALQNVRWEDGAAEPVFGEHSVRLYTGAPAPDALPPGFPLAFVTLEEATADETHPGLLSQGFSVAVAVEVAGDAYGQNAVMGGARANLGRSAGAGVAEVSERVRAAIQDLDAYDGARIQVSGTGMSAPQMLEHRHVVFDSFRVQVLCTSQPDYTAPQEFRLVGGIARWRGEFCGNRFDFLQYRMGYKAGSTPAADPSELDSVLYTGTADEAVTGDPEPNRVYSVFADYDPRGTGSPALSSSALVGSWVAT